MKVRTKEEVRQFVSGFFYTDVGSKNIFCDYENRTVEEIEEEIDSQTASWVEFLELDKGGINGSY